MAPATRKAHGASTGGQSVVPPLSLKIAGLKVQ